MYFISLDTKQAGAIEAGCVAWPLIRLCMCGQCVKQYVYKVTTLFETGSCAGISRPAGFA